MRTRVNVVSQKWAERKMTWQNEKEREERREERENEPGSVRRVKQPRGAEAEREQANAVCNCVYKQREERKRR